MSLSHEIDSIQEHIVSTAADERTNTMNNEHSDIFEKLAAPFRPSEISWKPQVVAGNRAMVIAYVDARAVMQRLDSVVGFTNWSDSYDVLASGGVVCNLSVRIGDQWITKCDVGAMSRQDDEGDRVKSAFSDSLKRAAVRFSIARYLYALPTQWVDYDPKSRRIASEPTLPPWATTNGDKQDAPELAPTPQNGDQPLSGRELFRTLKQLEKDLQRQGLCNAGELVEAIAQAGQRAGIGTRITQWNGGGVDVAREATRQFIASKKSTKSNSSSAS